MISIAKAAQTVMCLKASVQKSTYFKRRDLCDMRDDLFSFSLHYQTKTLNSNYRQTAKQTFTFSLEFVSDVSNLGEGSLCQVSKAL